jgi:thymidylate kinase
MTPEEKVCGRALFAVFATLEEALIPYCVLHGYDGYPGQMGSDVDCAVSGITPQQLTDLLKKNKDRIGADVVRSQGLHLTLQCVADGGRPQFLVLDFHADCEIDGVVFVEGEKILASRRRHQQFWIPSAGVEFHCYLASSISKNLLDDKRGQRLSALYREAPEDCRLQLLTFWSKEMTDQFCQAAASNNWAIVSQRLKVYRSGLKWRLFRNAPVHFVARFLGAQTARVKRLISPPGLTVALLGPDGAGKSSVIEALEKSMAGPFARVHVRGFAPPLHRLWRRGPVNTSQPHGLAPRSLVASIVRAGYWTLYNTAGHLSVYWAKARATLVLYDRHFVDILVDPVRYRYGGPRWLLQLIWRVMPKPDAIILLNAPPEVLQARKQELTLKETERQCRDYLALVQKEKTGHVVNAAQPSELVMHDVCKIIFDLIRH